MKLLTGKALADFEARLDASFARYLAALPAPLLKGSALVALRAYNPDQPRAPAGSPEGGQFGSGGGDAKEGGTPKATGVGHAAAKALDAHHAEAAARGVNAIQYDLLARAPSYDGPRDEAVIQDHLDKAFHKAEITVNFQPQKAGDIAADPNLRNAFETGKPGAPGARSKGYMETREAQEKTVLGTQKDMPAGDRPKYAAVNWQNNQYGAAPEYGHASIVLNKDALAGRTTMTPANSFGHRDSSRVATLEQPTAAAVTKDGLKAAGLPHGDPHLNQGYTEVQIWGGMPLNKDTVKEIRVPSMQAHHEGVGKLVEWGQKNEVPVNFFHEETGQHIPYETAKGWAKDAAAKAQPKSWLGKLFGGKK